MMHFQIETYDHTYCDLILTVGWEDGWKVIQYAVTKLSAVITGPVCLRVTQVGQLPLMSGFQKVPSGWQMILAVVGA